MKNPQQRHIYSVAHEVLHPLLFKTKGIIYEEDLRLQTHASSSHFILFVLLH